MQSVTRLQHDCLWFPEGVVLFNRSSDEAEKWRRGGSPWLLDSRRLCPRSGCVHWTLTSVTEQGKKSPYVERLLRGVWRGPVRKIVWNLCRSNLWHFASTIRITFKPQTMKSEGRRSVFYPHFWTSAQLGLKEVGRRKHDRLRIKEFKRAGYADSMLILSTFGLMENEITNGTSIIQLKKHLQKNK